METLVPMIFAGALIYFISRERREVESFRSELHREYTDTLKKEIELRDKEYRLAKEIADLNARKREELERQLAKQAIEQRALPFFIRDERDEKKIEVEAKKQDKDDLVEWLDEVPGLGR